MDLVTLSIDLLLVSLLVAALVYGVRLERRLKALREGHAVFAQAVRELDQSVLRAEAGLDQLRKAGEEARDGLHDRILKAREAKAELERLIARAERLRAQPQAQPQPHPQPRSQFQPTLESASQPPPVAVVPSARRAAPARGEEAAERVAAAILSLGESERLREPHREPLRESRLPEPAEPRPSRRARALDDDLFESPAPELRRAVGLRR